MYVSLQQGLYDLCAERIAGDPEFKAAHDGEKNALVDNTLFDEYRLFQLKRTLLAAYNKSRFYRKLFDAHHIAPEDVRRLSDISKLPFTVPTDLSGNSYGFLCTSQGDVEKPVTFYSSGATGMKKRIFFSAADVRRIMEFLPRGMQTVISPRKGRIQVFLQNSFGRGIGQVLADSLISCGMQAWTSELSDPVEDIIKTTTKNRVNVWFGDAITIYRATKILSQTIDLSALGMECIFITMANIPPCMVEYLQNTWGCRVSTHYGLTESGWGLAVDCDKCNGYHYNELDMLIEIVDAETGRVLPCGESGEITLTTLSRDCMPLIRYRTGDIAKLTESICGSHLQVLGHIERRRDGGYYLGSDRYIWPAIFDEPIFSVPQVLDYRIFANGEQLYIDAETLDSGDEVSAHLSENLMALPELKDCPPPIVRLLPIGAMREFCFEKKRIIIKE